MTTTEQLLEHPMRLAAVKTHELRHALRESFDEDDITVSMADALANELDRRWWLARANGKV